MAFKQNKNTDTGAVDTLGVIGVVPNANSATLTGTTLNLEPASALFGGVVTTTAQTLAGDKTFNDVVNVAKTTGNTLIVDTDAFVVDATNNRVGINTNAPSAKLEIKGDASTDGVTLGPELLPGGTTGWSTTGTWTGDNTTGWGNGTSSAATISNTLAAVPGERYIISMTYGVFFSGTTIINFGGKSFNISVYKNNSVSTQVGILATTAASFSLSDTQISCTSLIFSIKRVTNSVLPADKITNSTGSSRYEVRATTLNNVLLGPNSGQYITAGQDNYGAGSDALSSLIAGGANTAASSSALRLLENGRNNLAFGAGTFSSMLNGTNNLGISSSLVSGDNNVLMGLTPFLFGHKNVASGVGISSFSTPAGAANYDNFYIKSGHGVTTTLATQTVAGAYYTISSVGTTNFTLIGASSNTVGLIFLATGVGVGSGRVSPAGNNENIAFLSGQQERRTGVENISMGKNTQINTRHADGAISLGTNSLQNLGGVAISVAEITIGQTYVISALGTTNFTLIGAVANLVDCLFTATGVGVGTGTVFCKSEISDSIAIGRNSQTGRVFLGRNVVCGAQALFNKSGIVTRNSAFGYRNMSALNTVAATNLVIGVRYLISSTGTANFTLVGATSNTVGLTFVATGTTTGTGLAALIVQDNSSFGDSSLNLAVGSYNSGFGSLSLPQLTTGNLNTAIGYNTGLGITTGSNNTILGANVTGLSPTLSNNIIIADGQGNQNLKIDNNKFATFAATVKTGIYTKATLPSAVTAGAGARAFITDGRGADNFTDVIGLTTGAVPMPVYSDGTDWRAG